MRHLLRLAAALLIPTTLAVGAGSGPAVNVDAQGVAIQGYDPVAFFTDGKPVAGKEGFTSEYHGATYRFASAEHKALFDQEPGKYEPQFGGFCAYGVAEGQRAPIKVEAFQIVDGRLLMQYDPAVRDLFNKDQAGNLRQADRRWPEVSARP